MSYILLEALNKIKNFRSRARFKGVTCTERLVSGITYYWFIFSGLLILTVTQLVAVLELVPNTSYGPENPVMFVFALCIFIMTSITVLIVFLEQKDRYGWLLALVWLLVVGIPVFGPFSYLGYWLSRIEGIKNDM